MTNPRTATPHPAHDGEVPPPRPPRTRHPTPSPPRPRAGGSDLTRGTAVCSCSHRSKRPPRRPRSGVRRRATRVLRPSSRPPRLCGDQAPGGRGIQSAPPPMGPSHRLTYREFDGPTAQHLPVRQVIAFEPRKDGRPFTVTAARLGRTKGVPLAELDELPNVTPAVGPSKEAGRPIGPARRPLPPDLEQGLKALDGQPSASGAVRTPGNQLAASRRGSPRKPSRER